MQSPCPPAHPLPLTASRGYYERPVQTWTSPEAASVYFGPMLNLTPLRLLVAGEFAVATFFVLSGFVSARVTCSPVLELTLSRRTVLLFRSIPHHTPS